MIYSFNSKSAIWWRDRGNKNTQCRRNSLNKANNNLQVNPLFRYLQAFIWPSTIDAELTSRVSQTRWRVTCTLLKDHRKNTETLWQSRVKTHVKTLHITKRGEKKSEKTFEAMWEWDIILMYKTHRHFGTHLEENTEKDNQKTTEKKENKITMYLVTPRGTQCDTLCIIASIFPLIFATEWREKVNFVLKWHLYHVHL